MRSVVRRSVRSPALKETLQQLILSIAAAAFAFHWFLYGYCTVMRPRQPVPESRMEYPLDSQTKCNAAESQVARRCHGTAL